jgi:hypothetical protein
MRQPATEKGFMGDSLLEQSLGLRRSWIGHLVSEGLTIFEKKVASARSKLILANRFLSYGKDLLD